MEKLNKSLEELGNEFGEARKQNPGLMLGPWFLDNYFPNTVDHELRECGDIQREVNIIAQYYLKELEKNVLPTG